MVPLRKPNHHLNFIAYKLASEQLRHQLALARPIRRRERFLWKIGWPVLAASIGWAGTWAFLSFNPAQSPPVRIWPNQSFSSATATPVRDPFRNCAEARPAPCRSALANRAMRRISTGTATASPASLGRGGSEAALLRHRGLGAVR